MEQQSEKNWVLVDLLVPDASIQVREGTNENQKVVQTLKDEKLNLLIRHDRGEVWNVIDQLDNLVQSLIRYAKTEFSD